MFAGLQWRSRVCVSPKRGFVRRRTAGLGRGPAGTPLACCGGRPRDGSRPSSSSGATDIFSLGPVSDSCSRSRLYLGTVKVTNLEPSRDIQRLTPLPRPGPGSAAVAGKLGFPLRAPASLATMKRGDIPAAGPTRSQRRRRHLRAAPSTAWKLCSLEYPSSGDRAEGAAGGRFERGSSACRPSRRRVRQGSPSSARDVINFHKYGQRMRSQARCGAVAEVQAGACSGPAMRTGWGRGAEVRGLTRSATGRSLRSTESEFMIEPGGECNLWSSPGPTAPGRPRRFG